MPLEHADNAHAHGEDGHHEDSRAGHDHSHAHAHAPKDFGKAFLIGVILNAGFVAAEVVYGILGNSLALLADAGHNLSDVLGLLLAWGASILVKRAPTNRYTYGLRSTSILAALANAALLLLVTGGIAWEAILRFRHPSEVEGRTVIAVAAVGVVINLATALLFMSGRKGDLNVRAAFQHMAGDAAIALGVVVAGFAILYTGWHWLDPAVSLVIALLVIFGTWGLLRDSVALALDAVPPGIDFQKVRSYLASLPGVSEVHDLHIWGMSTTETALTAHLLCPGGLLGDAKRMEICEELREHFAIHHATIQIELAEHTCELAPAHVV
ncbi:MAG: cation diffusion facilitator family transporter [Pseudomonadota bacterium]|nr:cation diffusion facilitator family transporter [Pseudomonadota bacterium]